MRPPIGSLLEQLETSFRLLTTGPRPLAVDGGRIDHDLPTRLVPLDELRRMLQDPATLGATRDTALRVLLGDARARRGAALIGLVGILLPGLRRSAWPLLGAYPARAADLEAEILTGLVGGIASIPLGSPRIAERLTCTAVRAGYRLSDQFPGSRGGRHAS
jgi:hypothetical protein